MRRLTVAALGAGVIVATIGGELGFGSGAPGDDAGEDGFAAAADRIVTVIETVLAHHVDPPARQQMVLEAAKLAYGVAEQPVPLGLSRRISDARSPEECRRILEGVLRKAGRPAESPSDRIDEEILQRLLGSLPGRGSLLPAKEHAVAEQVAANRYVGIGIALSLNGERKPVMHQVIEGGPADRAGARDGDVIEEIDGEPTEGKMLSEVVDMLRGPKGSQVSVVLRQPKQKRRRKLTMTRGVVPFKNVRAELLDSGGPPVAHVTVSRITASIAHELRGVEREFGDTARGVIIDLRRVGQTSAHHAVLLADALLDGGSIGRIKTVGGEKSYKATGDCVFRDLEMAVLVDTSTRGAAEWVAAALQDNDRAVIVGTPTAGRGFSEEGVPVPSLKAVVTLATGIFQRADGRPLVSSGARHRTIPPVLLRRKGGGAAVPSRVAKSPGPVHPDIEHHPRKEALRVKQSTIEQARRDNESVFRKQGVIGRAADLLRQRLRQSRREQK